MILSLFKVALLTLSTSLFSFPNGTSSQNNDLVPQTERNIVNPHIENTYVEYDDENDYESIEYVDILVTDTQTTYFDGLFSASQTGLVCPSDCIGYKFNGVWYDDDDLWSGAGRFNLILNTKTFTWSDYQGYNYYRINFDNHTIYRDIGNGIQQLEGIRIKNIPVNQTYSYTSWLSVGFITYIEQNPYYLTYSTNFRSLINYKYTNLADFFIQYGGSADNQIIFQWGINSAGNEYNDSTNNVWWVDENNIHLVCEGEYKGLFFYNDSAIYSFDTLTIKYINSNIGLAFFDAFMSDVNNYTIGSRVSFTFNQAWNHNAPFSFSAESFLVYSEIFDSETPYYQVVIDLPLFYTDGFNNYTFNRITVNYANAYGKYSVDSEGNPYVVNSYNYGYFYIMDYVNTNTGRQIQACSCVYKYVEIDGVPHQYPTAQNEWHDDRYRTITFVDNVSESDLSQLTRFNQNLLGSGITINENYLSSAFSLIGNAFSGIRSFMGIAVLPGITLGTLIIIPMAITLLFFVIRLFKR